MKPHIAYRMLLHAEWYLLVTCVTLDLVTPRHRVPTEWAAAFDILYRCRQAIATDSTPNPSRLYSRPQ